MGSPVVPGRGGVRLSRYEAWRRHANPWSVVLRNTALPVLILAFWSRLWIGWWALVPVAVALLWTWLNRDAVPIPIHHPRAPNVLSAVSGVGMLFVAWGVLRFEAWPTLFGAALVYLGKLWFLDRMVWLWHDMRDVTEEYRGWAVSRDT